MLKSSFAARLAAPVLCACLAAAPARAQVQALTLPQALREARDNLDVALARGGLAAARADVLAANRAPFPVLSGKLSSIDLQNGVGSGPWHSKRIDKGIGIDWTWERGDKRVLRTRGAEETAGAAAQDLDEVVVRQMLAAQGAFYDLLAAQQRLALTEALADDVRQLADSSGRRARAGDLARQDATRIEIEAERVRADAEATVLERQRAALALGLLTGRAQQAERLAVAGDWPPLASAAASADLAALAQARPDVRAAARRVQAAQAAADGARALRKADVTWGVSLNHYPGTSTRLVELRAQQHGQIDPGQAFDVAGIEQFRGKIGWRRTKNVGQHQYPPATVDQLQHLPRQRQQIQRIVLCRHAQLVQLRRTLVQHVAGILDECLAEAAMRDEEDADHAADSNPKLLLRG